MSYSSLEASNEDLANGIIKLGLNLKTATSLDLSVAPSLLTRADEMIE